ncbi:hypothetical protein CUC15_19450 [Oceanobacillus zhaokaii]|uniref:Uncharacterized protein n=1 Tax=Oceanobacillus zhaokaii TaxID=2052660 RepID=A0A345PLT9_9BACI|nr:hypothetical protein [Oceanobacillus zhaokaii]AXI10969.1 hypothetical protein CUC15_19450 [Oceanobacillus zhaokaii]
MIYRKDANFPYPVLSNTSHSYAVNFFDLDVNVSENADDYHFDFSYEIDSEFMIEKLDRRKAQLILIIQSKDNKFYKLEPGQRTVKIHKSRISLNKRTSIQLHIQAMEDINFADNNDLSEFYIQFREELKVPKFSLLGYSNVIIFDGSITKPFELFEKKVDENLKSDIKVELGQETIIIHYKSPEFQFNHLPKSNVLNNPYIYAGLSKALQAFIINNSKDGDVDLESMDEPDGSLDLKLYNLMKTKKVTELNMDNIDEVIYMISDRIIERYTAALGGLVTDGS